MSDNPQCRTVEGIKCYSPDVAISYENYPDNGFDLTDKNARSSFWVSSRNRLFKNLVQANMSPTGKTKFLEIGCCTGDFISQIAPDERLEITGSEIYIKGLLYAKRNLPDVNFIQFDVTQPIVFDKFNLIVALDVIEHIEDDIAALFNINQLLMKNGVFIVSVPQHMFLWSKLDDIVKHKRRYSRRELIKKLQENSFEISFTSSFVFTLFPLMLISRIFDKVKNQSKSDEVEFKKKTTFPIILNWIFDVLMRIDEGLIRFGVSLPFGGTLIVVAKKL